MTKHDVGRDENRGWFIGRPETRNKSQKEKVKERFDTGTWSVTYHILLSGMFNVVRSWRMFDGFIFLYLKHDTE